MYGLLSVTIFFSECFSPPLYEGLIFELNTEGVGVPGQRFLLDSRRWSGGNGSQGVWREFHLGDDKIHLLQLNTTKAVYKLLGNGNVNLKGNRTALKKPAKIDRWKTKLYKKYGCYQT